MRRWWADFPSSEALAAAEAALAEAAAAKAAAAAVEAAAAKAASLFQITAAASEIDELEAKVVALGGRDDDPSVSKERLASRLTQTLCKVDVIETNGDAEQRAQRKKQYQRCLAALDSLEHH